MQVKDLLRKEVEKIVGDIKVDVETPDFPDHGDYSTSICMKLFSQKEKFPDSFGDINSPYDLAISLANKLNENKLLAKYFEKIEAKKPGFVNFFLSKSVLFENLWEIQKKGDLYGNSSKGRGKTVVIDYSAPNIAKKFSVGHLRSTIIGDTLKNLYESRGYKVIGDNHLGDWGTQFGMIITAVIEEKLEGSDLGVSDYQDLYVKYSKRAQNDSSYSKKAKEWFKKLEEGNERARAIWKKAVDSSTKEFEKIYNLLNVKIEYALGESFYEDKMPGVIEEVRRKGLSKKSKGAEIVELKDLVPAILLKDDGGTTYYTRDLATVKYRLRKWNPKEIIYEVGSEQTLHFRQVFESVKLLGWVDDTKLTHIAHGLFRIKGKKISTRKGNDVLLEEILKEAIKRAREILDKSETSKGLSEEEIDEISQKVGIGAIKYFELMHHPKSSIDFDWEKVFLMQGNSGPYIQYTFARCQSVLKKKKSQINAKTNLDLNEEELILVRNLFKFKKILKDSLYNYSPNMLCNYLFELSQSYNTFYNKHKIIGDKKESQRILMTKTVSQILKNGLKLLGIKTSERM